MHRFRWPRPLTASAASAAAVAAAPVTVGGGVDNPNVALAARRFAGQAPNEGDLEELIAVAQAELLDLLGLIECRFEPAPFSTTLTRMERQGSSGHRLVIHQEDMAPDWGPEREIELPVRGRSHQLGRFVLELPANRRVFHIPAAAREMAFAVADELGTALAAAWSAPPSVVSPPPLSPD